MVIFNSYVKLPECITSDEMDHSRIFPRFSSSKYFFPSFYLQYLRMDTDIFQSQIDFFPSFSYKISAKSQISEPFLLDFGRWAS